MLKPSVGFVSLGCPKALVDSERILTQLRAEGYDIVPSYEDASVVVVNTCGFIDSAKAESLAAIGEALEHNGRVIVTGCLGAQGDLIKNRYPNVLHVSGAHAYEAVMEAVHTELPPPHDPFIDLVPPQGIKLTPRHYAYIKISEGCNHRCSFCIIPSMRGKLASRSIDEVLIEAENLKRAGVQELLVISQDTSAYGVDLKYRTVFWNGKPIKSRFKELCEALASLGIWVRLHYVYPYPHVDDVIPLMNVNGGLLPYLDIPLQHASPKILQLMRRPAGGEDHLARIAHWRSICPELVIRSTFIVGFPGETEDDFQMLLDFLEEAELDRVGCFQYSPVDGAAANALPGAVPDSVKEERFHRFMEAQTRISQRKLARKLNTLCTVLIDEVTETEAFGRTYAEAPDIDGQVIVTQLQTPLQPGQKIQARIIDTQDHDLIAVPVAINP